VPRRPGRKQQGWAALGGLFATVCTANWSAARLRLVDVGFGPAAPAAVHGVGDALTLRDIAHRELGAGCVCAGLIAAALLSLAIAPDYAVASGVVFLLSEMADLIVYSPLARRSWVGAAGLAVALLVAARHSDRAISRGAPRSTRTQSAR
jgi:hypothetical protein